MAARLRGTAADSPSSASPVGSPYSTRKFCVPPFTAATFKKESTMTNTIRLTAFLLATAALAACSGDDTPTPRLDAKATPMTFTAIYPGSTRATETAFEDGDRIGLFVAADSLPLETGGNLVNNEPLTLDGNTWATARTLYWDNGTYNAYAYYPFRQTISSIEEEPFSVSTDQSTPETATSLGGYEASDLLYAKSTSLRASAEPVALQFRHIMSKLKIRLIKGEDFKGEMPTTARVYIHNTATEATVDLAAGVVTPTTRATRHTITAHQESDYTYSAIIVPQRIDNRVPLIEVIMKGVSYIYESRFVFKPGMEHLVNLVISDNPEQVRIEIGGETTGWQ